MAQTANANRMVLACHKAFTEDDKYYKILVCQIVISKRHNILRCSFSDIIWKVCKHFRRQIMIKILVVTKQIYIVRYLKI